MLAKPRARDFEAPRGSARGSRAVSQDSGALWERRALARATLFAEGAFGAAGLQL